jgi:hypothetical protein
MINNTNRFPAKDPEEILDYQFDWAALDNNTGLTNWLEVGETILDHTVTVPAGITLVSSELINTGTTVLFWISGGTDGTDYEIECEIITDSRIGVRRRTLPVKKR